LEDEEPAVLKNIETALLWSNGEFDNALELREGGQTMIPYITVASAGYLSGILQTMSNLKLTISICF